jgi:hypothetical protein
MAKDADIVTITDSVCGSGKRSTCSMTDVAAIARLLYGAPPSSIRVVKSEADLVRVVREYSSIRRLIFVLEGSEGQIAVNHSYRALSVFAEAFQSQGPKVEEIFFDNCNVVKGGSEVALLMKALRARRATGYASFHSWGPVKIVTKKNDTAEGVDNELKKKLPGWDLLRDYVIPGQPSFSEMAAHPGEKLLYLEFFMRDPSFGMLRFENMRSPSQLHNVLPRSRLVPKTYKISAAQTAERELDVLGGPITLVTYEDPTAGQVIAAPPNPRAPGLGPAGSNPHTTPARR